MKVQNSERSAALILNDNERKYIDSPEYKLLEELRELSYKPKDKYEDCKKALNSCYCGNKRHSYTIVSNFVHYRAKGDSGEGLSVACEIMIKKLTDDDNYNDDEHHYIASLQKINDHINLELFREKMQAEQAIGLETRIKETEQEYNKKVDKLSKEMEEKSKSLDEAEVQKRLCKPPKSGKINLSLEVLLWQEKNAGITASYGN